MNIFKGQNLLEFSERFQTDLDCKKYLSEIKWNKGF
ncbi:MAG: IS1595 family transposase, partial [Flavobacteriaceae bacterium]|nr:IS1595 family transposase [Flavobacteriaceae bacterium]